MKETHTILLATYLLLLKNNKILLHHRNDVRYKPNMYGLVSGNVEKNESFIDAIIREAFEETGISIRHEDLTFVHCMHRLEDNEESIDMFFLATEWQGELRNVEPDKCRGLYWYDAINLPFDTIDYVRLAISNIIKNIKYSKFGWQ